jgi:hypothetical protein
MKTKAIFAGLGALALLAGCESIPPGAERGPHGTIAYQVQIEASDPGVRIEANGQVVGTAPLTLKIFGDPDGTFHDFGSYYYIIRALPSNTNQFLQTAVFRTGRLFTPEDKIPSRIYFDMHQAQPPPAYSSPYYPPPAYYYPPPYYWGPRIYFGPPVYWHHWR